MATPGDQRRVLALHVLARPGPAALLVVVPVAAQVAPVAGSVAGSTAGSVAVAGVAQRRRRRVPTEKKCAQPGQ
jgi:hypothetical protein